MTEGKIEASNAMADFLAGAGFSLPCSESCSESTDSTPDNVISIDAIMQKKLAKI